MSCGSAMCIFDGAAEALRAGQAVDDLRAAGEHVARCSTAGRVARVALHDVGFTRRQVAEVAGRSPKAVPTIVDRAPSCADGVRRRRRFGR